MAPHLQEMLANFPGQRLLIVGDVMLDEYLWSTVQRISPEAPVPVIQVQRRSYVAGGAANTATNVLSLGGNVLLAGAIGSDHPGEVLRQVLAAHSIDGAGLIVDPERPTTVKTRVIAQNQQVARIDSEQTQPLPSQQELQLLQWIAAHLPMADGCILSDYGKGVVSQTVAQNLIQLARSLHKPVIVDPKGSNYRKYQGATVITPNLLEAKKALGLGMEDEIELLELGQRLLVLLEPTQVLITRGAEGMSLFQHHCPAMHIPTTARQVFDVTGAGDTVVSTLAMALAGDTPLAKAAQLASRAAGLVVAKVGTATVSLEELDVELLR